jgi:hypothetical protein
MKNAASLHYEKQCMYCTFSNNIHLMQSLQILFTVQSEIFLTQSTIGHEMKKLT